MEYRFINAFLIFEQIYSHDRRLKSIVVQLCCYMYNGATLATFYYYSNCIYVLPFYCCNQHLLGEVLNITWKDKIRNEDVLLRISSCKFKPKRILACITESQLTWFGHVCRISNMRLPKRILMEMVPGTNRQGRPRKRREDDIIAGRTFLEAYRNAEDRNRWADCSWSQRPLGNGAKLDR